MPLTPNTHSKQRERDVQRVRRLKHALSITSSIPAKAELLAGRSESWIARAAGVTQPEVWAWMRGARGVPKVHEGIALALAMGVDVHVLSAYLVATRVSWLAAQAARKARGEAKANPC